MGFFSKVADRARLEITGTPPFRMMAEHVVGQAGLRWIGSQGDTAMAVARIGGNPHEVYIARHPARGEISVSVYSQYTFRRGLPREVERTLSRANREEPRLKFITARVPQGGQQIMAVGFTDESGFGANLFIEMFSEIGTAIARVDSALEEAGLV